MPKELEDLEDLADVMPAGAPLLHIGPYGSISSHGSRPAIRGQGAAQAIPLRQARARLVQDLHPHDRRPRR